MKVEFEFFDGCQIANVYLNKHPGIIAHAFRCRKKFEALKPPKWAARVV